MFSPLSVILAGSVIVHTGEPAELRRDGLFAVQTFGPTELVLPGLTEGQHAFSATVGGRNLTLSVNVPKDGEVGLKLAGGKLVSEPAGAPAQDTGMLELRAAAGQRFLVMIDGARWAVVGADQAVRAEDLSPGEHKLELRTTDALVVWNRGSLRIGPGERLIITATEGRMLQVFGRDGSWIPDGGGGMPSDAAPGQGG